MHLFVGVLQVDFLHDPARPYYWPFRSFHPTDISKPVWFVSEDVEDIIVFCNASSQKQTPCSVGSGKRNPSVNMNHLQSNIANHVFSSFSSSSSSSPFLSNDSNNKTQHISSSRFTFPINDMNPSTSSNPSDTQQSSPHHNTPDSTLKRSFEQQTTNKRRQVVYVSEKDLPDILWDSTEIYVKPFRVDESMFPYLRNMNIGQLEHLVARVEFIPERFQGFVLSFFFFEISVFFFPGTFKGKVWPVRLWCLKNNEVFDLIFVLFFSFL